MCNQLSSRLFFSTFLLISLGSTARANVDLQFTILSPGSFDATQLAVLEDGLEFAEDLWEGVITGYQPGITNQTISISVTAGSPFAEAQTTASTQQGGFTINTAGIVRINPDVIDIFASWDGTGPTIPNTEFVGVNFVDDILAHEVGHILGINAVTWGANGLVSAPGQYTGAEALATFRTEFNQPDAEFIPLEQAGGPGTANNHFDQILRSNTNPLFQEGLVANPGVTNPFDLSPLTGITDRFGRDLAQDLLSGAIDPDFGEPFLSNTSIASLRDLGFTTIPVPEPSCLSLALVSFILMGGKRRR